MDDSRISRIREWLSIKSPGAMEIGSDEDLIESRIIDSLSFMEFIFFLEELTGKEDLMDTATVDSFRSLGAIQRTFLTA